MYFFSTVRISPLEFPHTPLFISEQFYPDLIGHLHLIAFIHAPIYLKDSKQVDIKERVHFKSTGIDGDRSVETGSGKAN